MVAQSRTICTTLSRMVAQSNAGDTILFYFIGHGNRFVASYANNTGHDECMLCGDGSSIYDFQLKEIAEYVPPGVNFTVVADCCHSSGLIEGLNEVIGNNTRAPHYTNKRAPKSNFIKATRAPSDYPLGVLISAAQSDEKAMTRFDPTFNEKGSCLTQAILHVITQKQGVVTNLDLVNQVSRFFKERNVGQNPGLYCDVIESNSYFLGLKGLEGRVKNKDKEKEKLGKGKEKM
ncbi:unnamed protein product [Lathyrus oleraceus]